MNRPGEEEQPSKEQPMEEEKAEAKVLSILPIKDGIVFPKALLPMAVGQERSIKLIDDALIKDKIIGLVAVKNAEVEVPDPKDLYEIGSSGTILKMMKLPNGNLNILVQGLSRFRVKEFVQTEPFLRASIEVIEEGRQEGMEVDALMVSLKGLFQKAVELSPNIPSEVGMIVNNIDDPGSLSDLIAANFNVPVEEKQAILETTNVKERLEAVSKLLNRELQILELGSKIQSDLRQEMDKTQREYYLREQLKAIQKELGEEDERTVEIEEIRTKIKEAKMPQEAEQVALKELDRLSRMSPAAAEYTVSRTYLDWLVELPWSVKTEDRLDIDESSKILDEDHYDLDKVKKRMLEYLAVRKLKQDIKGPILCFVGPPGTGKTSLGKSIARALGRKFLRMSLGGVRDEAEIRGHRRTYVGALPGRIIQGIKKAGSLNPVLMLDEIGARP
jgi:ATP-dependent Lon protease